MHAYDHHGTMNMKLSIQGSRKKLLILLLATFAVVAAESVIINNVRYTCQNECVVRTYPGGGTSVSDSKGGTITSQDLSDTTPPET